MQTRHCVALLVGVTVLVGCAYDAAITSPGPAVVPGERRETTTADGFGAPSYNSPDEIPPEYRFAEVRNPRARVDWNGNTAESYASMEYFGNRASMHFAVSVLHEYSTVGSGESTVETGAYWPAWRMMGNPFNYAVPRACGQTANLNVQFVAKTVVLVPTAVTTAGYDQDALQDEAVQPDCTCGSDPKAVTEIAYDPYGGPNDGGGLEGGDCGGSGGGRTGKQYQPGDYTGGETVDWKTGQGNGGSSSCGAEAVVEYVCVDEWDGEKWVPWECGYATTC